MKVVLASALNLSRPSSLEPHILPAHYLQGFILSGGQRNTCTNAPIIKASSMTTKCKYSLRESWHSSLEVFFSGSQSFHWKIKWQGKRAKYGEFPPGLTKINCPVNKKFAEEFGLK